MNKPHAVIMDLDGTLCNTDHRIHHLRKDPKDWGAWNDGIKDDELNINVKRAVFGLIRPFAVDPSALLIVTGRFEKYRAATSRWLNKNNIVNYVMWMRAYGDFRSDTVVKEEIYHKFIEDLYEVDVVLEDRDKVVKMWRSIGLVCWQVAEGDY